VRPGCPRSIDHIVMRLLGDVLRPTIGTTRWARDGARAGPEQRAGTMLRHVGLSACMGARKFRKPKAYRTIAGAGKHFVNSIL
jgi:hypothetical protein